LRILIANIHTATTEQRAEIVKKGSKKKKSESRIIKDQLIAIPMRPAFANQN
jgi:hypothetical protein